MAGNQDTDHLNGPTAGDLKAAGIKARPLSDTVSRGYDSLERFLRIPNHALFLFTSEDTLLDRYIRDHWAALDGLSGEACDIHVSILQLLGGEDFYSQIGELRSISGLDVVRPIDLPALHLWSKSANCTIKLGRFGTEPDLRDALRAIFSIVHDSSGPITAEHVARLRRMTRVEDGIDHVHLEEDLVEPITVITLISSGLKLVDQFRELAMRFGRKEVKPTSGHAEQAGAALEVRNNGS